MENLCTGLENSRITGQTPCYIYGTSNENGKVGTNYTDVLKPASGVITRSRKDEKDEVNVVSLVENISDSDLREIKSESWISQKAKAWKRTMFNWFENAAFDAIIANNLHNTC
jgi:hypothetical protein